jgi:hypothetical protein
MKNHGTVPVAGRLVRISLKRVTTVCEPTPGGTGAGGRKKRRSTFADRARPTAVRIPHALTKKIILK